MRSQLNKAGTGGDTTIEDRQEYNRRGYRQGDSRNEAQRRGWLALVFPLRRAVVARFADGVALWGQAVALISASWLVGYRHLDQAGFKGGHQVLLSEVLFRTEVERVL